MFVQVITMQDATLEHEDGQVHAHFEGDVIVAVTEPDFDAMDAELGFSEPDGSDPVLDESLSAWEYILSDKRARVLLQRMRRVVVRISASHNAKMVATAFLIATGDDSCAQTSIIATAKQHGVSKATVSQVCVKWCAFLGKSPSAYMRSEASKINFKLANRRNTKTRKEKSNATTTSTK